MRLLIDTHIALWWVAAPSKISDGLRDVLSDPANDVFLSSIVLAEIAVKSTVGKLTAPSGIEDALLAHGLDSLPFEARHARTLSGLPLHHRDPFDRMLIAQAIRDELVLVSVDTRMSAYDVRVVP